MPRSGDAARRRLREAALALYRDQGYDATTAAQIAERAGVTERTYFRHFADKREVLFDGEAELSAALVEAVAAAPDGLAPLAVLERAFVAAVPLFVAGRSVAVRRAAVIAATPALQERALAKTAGLLRDVTQALVARGLDEPTARLAAQVGMAAFQRALESWDGRDGAGLEWRIAAAGRDVRRLG